MNPFFIMALQLNLDYTADLAPHEFERFANLIDPAWIDETLRQTGAVSLRNRRLPVERTAWLVIGLALFRNEPIWHIVQHLDLADGRTPCAPVPSAALAGWERMGCEATVSRVLCDRSPIRQPMAKCLDGVQTQVAAAHGRNWARSAWWRPIRT